MSDKGETEAQLLSELAELRRRVSELEEVGEELDRTEKALRESEERFRLLAENIDEVFWLRSPDGTEVYYVSPAYEAATGRTCESLYADPDSWLEVLHPQDRQRFVAAQAARKAGPYEHARDDEVRFMRRDGSMGWFWMRTKPVFDGDGNIVARVGVAADITERKQAEEAYRALVDHSLQGLVILQDGRIVFANQAFADISGYTLEELSSLPPEAVEAMVHEEDREFVWGRYRDRLAGKDVPPRYEYRSIRKNGDICWLEMVSRRIEYKGRPAIQATLVNLTERKQAERALRRRAGELEALQATVLDITVPHDLPILLETIVQRAARLLNAPIGGLYLCEPEQRQVRCVVSYRTPSDYRGMVLAYGEGAAGTVAETGRPLLITDYSTWSGRAVAFEEEQPFRAALAVPMIWRGQVTGVIDVVHHAEDAVFTQADLELLSLFANHAAIAVENTRLYGHARQELVEREKVEKELRKSMAELEALRTVGLELATELDLDNLLHSIVSQAVSLVGGRSGGLYLYRPERDLIEWAVTIGPDLAPTANVLQLGEGLSGRVWQTGEPLIVDDYQHWEGQAAIYAGRPWKAVIGVPVHWGDKFLGVLDVLADTPGAFSGADAKLLSLFATQAAVAIENARLYAETQERLREQTALRQAGAIISSSLDADTVLGHIAEQMGRAIDATSAYISSYQPTAEEAVVLAEWIGPHACDRERVSDLGVAYAEDGGPEWLELMEAGEHDISHIDDPDLLQTEREHMRLYGAKTILYVPLRIKGQLIGYAEIWESRRRREFTPQEIALCQDVAQQAAIALENAQLFNQAQQEIAERKRAEEEREQLILKLQEALAQVKTLRGLLPICSSCKKIRDDEGYWTEVEVYLLQHSEAAFSHGICPDCAEKLYPWFKAEGGEG